MRVLLTDDAARAMYAPGAPVADFAAVAARFPVRRAA
jgi:hypothetical protein